MGRRFAKDVKIFDKVDDTKNWGVIYLVKYFHIFCKFPAHINSILSKNTGHDHGNTMWDVPGLHMLNPSSFFMTHRDPSNRVCNWMVLWKRNDGWHPPESIRKSMND